MDAKPRSWWPGVRLCAFFEFGISLSLGILGHSKQENVVISILSDMK